MVIRNPRYLLGELVLQIEDKEVNLSTFIVETPPEKRVLYLEHLTLRLETMINFWNIFVINLSLVLVASDNRRTSSEKNTNVKIQDHFERLQPTSKFVIHYLKIR